MIKTKRSFTLIGETAWRDRIRPFGIAAEDRLAHVYVVGKTGTGKSTLLATMLREDARNGAGFALLDPHGDLLQQVADFLKETGRHDVIVFDVADDASPLSWNPLAQVPRWKQSMAASGILEAMKKLWLDSWGPRVEHILRNALLALFELPDATMADILRLLTDADYRERVANHLDNPQVAGFWLREYPQYTYGFRMQAIAPLQNKVGAFLADPRLRRVLGSPKTDIDLRAIMDSGAVLLVNLSKGKIGEDASSLLGALLVSQIGTIGLSRADLPPVSRRDFYVYLDEFQTFATPSFAEMLSELRKYRVGLVLAHQYLGQLDNEVRDAVLGNAGTTICFRIGIQDTDKMSAEFAPEFPSLDLAYLPNHHFVVRLMKDGITSTPFSGKTLTAEAQQEVWDHLRGAVA
jgi:hypothetical protein